MGRLSNFELARVVAMAMIVFYHFGVDSNFKPDEHPKDADDKEIPYKMPLWHYAIFVSQSIGKVGVSLFMILSGYFLGTKSCSLQTILRTWFRVLSWCWIIPLLNHVFRNRAMHYEDWLFMFFPVLTCRYWFVSMYLLTMFISPVLAKIVRHASVKEYVGLFATMFYALSVTMYWKDGHRFKDFAYSRWIWFIFLYLVGAFIRVHPERLLPQWNLRGYSISLSVLFASQLFLVYYLKAHSNMQWVKDNGGSLALFDHDNSIYAFLLALNIFMVCSKLKFESRVINFLAANTFSVYLIHDHYMVRYTLFMDFLQTAKYCGTSYFFPAYFLTPISVYLGCTLLEAIRQRLFSGIESYVCNHLAEFISKVGEYVSYKLGLEETKETEDDFA